MNIAIASIGEADFGGAGLSALKLHHQLRRMGMQSKLYVNRKKAATRMS